MYELISSICSIFQDLADLVWGFPTNIAWYASLPVIGELPLVIILLVGTGIYFTCNLRFVQIKYFRYGLNVLINSHKEKQGISPLASFLLSTAMRVGPGNILGVTGASMTRVANSGAGGITCKSISKERRKGHPTPVIQAYEHGLVNAVGLSSIGVADTMAELKQVRQNTDGKRYKKS